MLTLSIFWKKSRSIWKIRTVSFWKICFRGQTIFRIISEKLSSLPTKQPFFRRLLFRRGTRYGAITPKVSGREVIEKLNYLYEKHSGLFDKKWDEEMLATLLSMQEGISRLRDRSVVGNSRRGTGTVRLIENFSLIGNTDGEKKPLMTITSGRTQIRFNGKYSLKPYTFEDSVFGHKSRKIIAFNQSNSIYERPNSESVIKLEQCFPGTIISHETLLHRGLDVCEVAFDAIEDTIKSASSICKNHLSNSDESDIKKYINDIQNQIYKINHVLNTYSKIVNKELYRKMKQLMEETQDRLIEGIAEDYELRMDCLDRINFLYEMKYSIFLELLNMTLIRNNCF